jgi:hypothetical protein
MYDKGHYHMFMVEGTKKEPRGRRLLVQDAFVMTKKAYTLARRKITEAHRQNEEALDLMKKGLTALPPEIGQLTALRMLFLRGNRLTALPSEIGQLRNLEILDLCGNNLKTLPPEIVQLTNLHILDLRGNKDLNGLMPEILNLIASQTINRTGLLVWGPDLSEINCSTCIASIKGDPRIDQMFVNSSAIDVRVIESRATGWLAKGVGHIYGSQRCPRCGMMYDTILRAIPIHCSTFTCPKCKAAEHLSFKVARIDAALHEFNFEVDIECARCNRRNSIKAAIKSVLDIGKIKVGPSGVTLEKK